MTSLQFTRLDTRAQSVAENGEACAPVGPNHGDASSAELAQASHNASLIHDARLLL